MRSLAGEIQLHPKPDLTQDKRDELWWRGDDQSYAMWSRSEIMKAVAGLKSSALAWCL
jgi:hypothetical protein